MKSMIAVLALFPLSVAAATGQMHGPGVVRGIVLNGTHPKAAIAGQMVTLGVYIDGQEAQDAQKTSRTDADGRFRFEDLPIGKQFAYEPQTVFEGVTYYGKPARLSDTSTSAVEQVLVYKATTSDSTVQEAMHHILIEPGQGSLAVREVAVYTNTGDRTYVGDRALDEGKRVVLDIALPAGAQKLDFGGDLMSCCVVVKGDRLFDTMEFKPGQRRVGLTYVLPYSGSRVRMQKTINDPTNNLDVFVRAPFRLTDLVISGNGTNRNALSDRAAVPAVFPINQKDYYHYPVGAVPTASTVTLEMSELPRTARDFRWLAPVALVALMATGYGVHRWRKRRETPSRVRVSAEPDSADRVDVLKAMVRLEIRRKANEISETAFRQEYERLERLLHRAEEGESGERDEDKPEEEDSSAED